MLSVDAIKGRAKELGFDLCGIAPADDLPELDRLRGWLDRGYGGEMAYLEKSAHTREDIRRFLPTARSVIVTGTVYYTDTQRTADNGPAGTVPASVARYAWGEDYHLVLAERLEALVAWLRETYDGPFDAAICVDKHHVQERVDAKRAGLGWIGKNTCVIHPEIGSWMLLAGVAVSLDLPRDEIVPDHCGQCTLCIDACPTGAIVDAHEIDARRCISYLTIELKGPIPEDQRPAIGAHLFGCDICQEVCPYNLAPLLTEDPAWHPRAGRDRPDAAALWRRPDAALHDFVRGSAMTHTTLSRLRRNLAVVLGNAEGPGARDALNRAGEGVRNAAPSVETPLVHEHVAWANAVHEPRNRDDLS
jgi:epoxyqueuosine reductase